MATSSTVRQGSFSSAVAWAETHATNRDGTGVMHTSSVIAPTLRKGLNAHLAPPLLPCWDHITATNRQPTEWTEICAWTGRAEPRLRNEYDQWWLDGLSGRYLLCPHITSPSCEVGSMLSWTSSTVAP